jgi:hypothetical protein
MTAQSMKPDSTKTRADEATTDDVEVLKLKVKELEAELQQKQQDGGTGDNTIPVG